jgi:hypothetical protein
MKYQTVNKKIVKDNIVAAGIFQNCEFKGKNQCSHNVIRHGKFKAAQS